MNWERNLHFYSFISGDSGWTRVRYMVRILGRSFHYWTRDSRQKGFLRGWPP